MFDLDKPDLAWMRQVENLNVAIRALQIIRQRAEDGELTQYPYYPTQGICGQWLEELGELGVDLDAALNWSHDTIIEAGATWPHSRYPGLLRSYPVPPTEHMWQGEGLELRLSLIDYTLTLLRATLEAVRGQED